MWITPKINWVATDHINSHDYNRIQGNLKHIADEFSLLIAEYENQDYTQLPHPEKWNIAEDNLELINQLTYDFEIGAKKEFRINTPYIDYQELNRIESATLKIQNVYLNILTTSRHLAFRLNGTKIFDCPRNISGANADVMGNRLQFRLGEERGEYDDD